MPGNPSHFWLWPTGRETEAEAYRVAANAAATVLLSEPTEWYPANQIDAWGQPVVAKFWGGPWQYGGEIIPEGPTQAALRENAVEVEDWDRPPPPPEEE